MESVKSHIEDGVLATAICDAKKMIGRTGSAPVVSNRPPY